MPDNLVPLPPSGPELLKYLESLLPGFETFWTSDDNLFGSADTPTEHSVFAAFSHFVRDHAPDIPHSVVKELLQFVEACVIEPDDIPISNAAATCFIENLAGESFLAKYFQLLGPQSRAIYCAWEASS